MANARKYASHDELGSLPNVEVLSPRGCVTSSSEYTKWTTKVDTV